MTEPTNYLDQQSLLALGNAIKNFKGGIVIISHNSNFVESCCSEVWEMNGGRLKRRVRGSEDVLGLAVEEEDDSHLVDAAEMSKEKIVNKNEQQNAPEENDATQANQTKKKPTREPGKKKETRRDRLRKEKIKLDKLKKYGPKAGMF